MNPAESVAEPPYQAHDPQGNEDPALTMNQLIHSVHFQGSIGVIGVFIPQDPGGRDEAAQQGQPVG